MVPDLGGMLVELAASARHKFVMCAPFAKQMVIDRLLEKIPAGVELLLITRWRPEEVAAGVSDTTVLESMWSRKGVVYLHDRLHAKYYRNESQVLLGSANLTATALGWSAVPNLELLVEVRSDHIEWLENLLLAEGVVATQAMADEVEGIAKLLPKGVTAELREKVAGDAAPVEWIPQLRAPSSLYSAYVKGVGLLTTRSAPAAAADLAALDLPPGLDERQFKHLVGHRLRVRPLFIELDQFVEKPRRFGEVSRMLAERNSCDRVEADEVWQTVMRWMLEFMPDRYERHIVRHTEVFKRLKHETEQQVW